MGSCKASVSKVVEAKSSTGDYQIDMEMAQMLTGVLLSNSECYRRVELLRNRQDEMKEKLKEAMRLRAAQEKEEEDVGSEDEEELQDLLSQDWRVKGALL